MLRAFGGKWVIHVYIKMAAGVLKNDQKDLEDEEWKHVIDLVAC